MSTPDLSPELFAYHQRFNGGQPITSDDERERFTAGFASLARRIDPRWGRKARASNAPTSSDTIAYWLDGAAPSDARDGRVDARDLINGSTGAVQWLGAGDPSYDNISARWIPVPPADDEPPVPVPELPPADELAALFDNVAKIVDGLLVIQDTIGQMLGVIADIHDRGLKVRFR